MNKENCALKLVDEIILSYRHSSTRASPEMCVNLSLSWFTGCPMKDQPTSDAYALFMSSEILYVNVTRLNLSLLRSHVCCNLWHNVHTYLSFLLTKFTFCSFMYKRAASATTHICIHLLTRFFPMEDHGRRWVVVLHIMLTVYRHWLHYVSLQAEIKAGMRTSTQHYFKHCMVCLSK